VFFGQLERYTHCRSVSEDYFVIQLPWMPNDNLSLEIQVRNLDPQSHKFDSILIPFVKDGVLEQSPMTAYQLNAAKWVMVVEWEVYSSIYSETKVVSSLLQGDFDCAAPLEYITLVPKLPPILDVIFEELQIIMRLLLRLY
jgi:hypothetical protein